MSFQDQLTADVSNVFLNADEFAETITYTPQTGAASSIDCIFTEESSTDQQEQVSAGVRVRRTATVIIRSADIAAPRRHDTVTRSAETWSVERVQRLPHGAHRLYVVIGYAGESAPGHRRR